MCNYGRLFQVKDFGMWKFVLLCVASVSLSLVNASELSQGMFLCSYYSANYKFQVTSNYLDKYRGDLLVSLFFFIYFTVNFIDELTTKSLFTTSETSCD